MNETVYNAVHSSSAFRVIFTEMQPEDSAMLDSNSRNIYVHYDNAYRFIFSLHGGLNDSNLAACCRIAMQRIERTIDAKVVKALQESSRKYDNTLFKHVIVDFYDDVNMPHCTKEPISIYIA